MSDRLLVAVATVLVVTSAGGAARHATRRRPRRAHRDGRPTRRTRTALVVVIAGGALAAATATGLTPLLLAAGGLISIARLRRRQRRRTGDRRAAEAALPEAIDLLVVAVHAGLSPRQAMAELAADVPAAVRPAFAAVTHQLHRGASLAEAIGELPRHAGPPAIPVALSIAQADRDGLPLGAVLDRLADEGRQLRRRQAEADARRLPVRLSFPLVACTLPSFVLIVIAPAVLGAISSLRGSAPP